MDDHFSKGKHGDDNDGKGFLEEQRQNRQNRMNYMRERWQQTLEASLNVASAEKALTEERCQDATWIDSLTVQIATSTLVIFVRKLNPEKVFSIKAWMMMKKSVERTERRCECLETNRREYNIG